MATYWHRHPRDFANECDLVRAETQAEAEALEDRDYDRLTRRELADHIHWINGENDSFGSNRAFGRIVLLDVTSAPYYSYSAVFGPLVQEDGQ